MAAKQQKSRISVTIKLNDPADLDMLETLRADVQKRVPHVRLSNAQIVLQSLHYQCETVKAAGATA